MNWFGSAVFVVVGLLAIGRGVHQLRMIRHMRRSGTRSVGVVVGHKRESGDDGYVYAPVVSFAVDHGQQEFLGGVRRERPRPPVGVEVPVVYLPGRPETARIDTRSQNGQILGLCFGIGTVFVVVGLFLAIR
jgi:hypothetical protein